MQGYPGKPSALAFDGTNTLLATSGGLAVTVWSFQGNGPEGTSPSSLELHVRPITTLAFSMRGRRLASGGRDGGVAIWSLKENGEGGVAGAAIVSDVIANLAWRPDDRALAALDSGGWSHRLASWRRLNLIRRLGAGVQNAMPALYSPVQHLERSHHDQRLRFQSILNWESVAVNDQTLRAEPECLCPL